MSDTEEEEPIVLSSISPKTLDKFDIYQNISLNQVTHTLFDSTYTINLPNFDNHKESEDDVLDIKLFSSYLATILAFYNRNAQLKMGKYNVCLYNLIPENNINNILEYFMAIDFINWNVRIPIETINWINTNCSQNESVSLFILPIRLEFINDDIDLTSEITCTLDNPYNPLSISEQIYTFKNTYSAHSNVIIIDKLLKKIEFYEPHGNQIGINNASLFNIEKILDTTIRSLLPFTAEYTFINVSNICPYGLGAQTIQNQKFHVGHCLAWSLYFILLRLYNHEITEKLFIENNFIISPIMILNHFVTSTSDSFILNSNIRKFISFLKELSNDNLLIDLELYNNPQTMFYLDIIELNLIDKEIVYSRIEKLTHAFCKNQLTFNKKDQVIIFEELVSYRKFVGFHKYFIKSFCKYIIDNLICFIYYSKISKIITEAHDDIINYHILNYIDNFFKKIDTIDYDFDILLTYRLTTDSFYEIFFKHFMEKLLDYIILDYQKVVEI